MINTVRRERNGITHPHFIDLDLNEAQLTEEFSDFNEQVQDMLDILKTTAGSHEVWTISQVLRGQQEEQELSKTELCRKGRT